MNTRQRTVLAVTLGLIGLTAVLLAQMSGSQKLGRPGVVVVPEPTYVTGGELIRTQSVRLPEKIDGYTSKPMEITTLESNWLPKDTLFGRRLYQGEDGFQAQVNVVLMGTDRTSIHKPQFCLDGQGWRIDKTEQVVIPVAQPHQYPLRALKLTTAAKYIADEKGEQHPARCIYVYWFVADNLLTPDHGERMWWMARELIKTGVLQRWAYVSYLTLCDPGREDAAYARLVELIAVSVPEFQSAAGATTQGPVRSVLSETRGVANTKSYLLERPLRAQ